MMLVDKNILIISPEPWNHIFVSKHHYAVHLGKRNNNVFFLNPPRKKETVAQTRFKNVFEVNYKGFPPGLRFYPVFIQKYIIARVYRKLEELCRTSFQVVWSFDNSVFFDFSALPESVLTISHIVDANQDFQTARAASSAEYCFCVSEVIKTKLLKYRKRVFKINHGYSSPEVAETCDRTGHIGKVTAVYAGNLSIPYLDWDVLSNVIDTHPDVDFLLIGPEAKTRVGEDQLKRLANKRNVFFVGKVESCELAAYYQLADVLLVAYQEKFHGDQTSNSHKIMEYLGSGKVIVATDTIEYENFYPLIVMSQGNSEWPLMFGKTIENLSYYNSDNLRSQRIFFAQDNTYDRQLDRIEQIISMS